MKAVCLIAALTFTGFGQDSPASFYDTGGLVLTTPIPLPCSSIDIGTGEITLYGENGGTVKLDPLKPMLAWHAAALTACVADPKGVAARGIVTSQLRKWWSENWKYL